MIYLLNAIGLTPSGCSTLHVYTQTINRTTQLTQTIYRSTQLTYWEECGPCLFFASYTLAFALQLKKKDEKTSVNNKLHRFPYMQLYKNNNEICKECFKIM